MQVGEDGIERRVTLSEDNLGTWPLPPVELQPATVAELTRSVSHFLHVHSPPAWRYKYMYFGEPIHILSDASLREAFAHFRKMAGCLSEADASLHCRLYLLPPPAAPVPAPTVTALEGEAVGAARARVHALLDGGLVTGGAGSHR